MVHKSKALVTKMAENWKEFKSRPSSRVLQDSTAVIPGTPAGRSITGWWLYGKQLRVCALHLMGQVWGGLRESSQQITLFKEDGRSGWAFLQQPRSLEESEREFYKYV